MVDSSWSGGEDVSVEALEDAVRQKKRAMAHEAKELKKRVRAGEVDGDPLALFACALNGVPNDALTHVLETIQRQMRTCGGELLLVVTRREECAMRSVRDVGNINPRWYYIDTRLVLGVVTGAELVVDLTIPRCALPTSQCLYVRDLGESEPRVVAEHIQFSPGDLVCEVYAPHGAYMFLPPALEVVVGNSAVVEWVKSNFACVARGTVADALLHLVRCAEMLGVVLELPEVAEARTQHMAEVIDSLRSHVLQGGIADPAMRTRLSSLLEDATRYGLSEVPVVTVADLIAYVAKKID